jgi:hypothetical protein
MSKLIIKEIEVKELLERVVKEYMSEWVKVDENGDIIRDGDKGVMRNELMDDFVDYINNIIW